MAPSSRSHPEKTKVGFIMTILKTTAQSNSADFRSNSDAMQKLVDNLNQTVAEIELGGGEAARKKHTGRGKLLPRERIKKLVDPGSPFLEFSQLAGFEMYDTPVPAGSIIT